MPALGLSWRSRPNDTTKERVPYLPRFQGWVVNHFSADVFTSPECALRQRQQFVVLYPEKLGDCRCRARLVNGASRDSRVDSRFSGTAPGRLNNISPFIWLAN